MIRAIVGTAVVIAAYSGTWLVARPPRYWGYIPLCGAAVVFAAVYRRRIERSTVPAARRESVTWGSAGASFSLGFALSGGARSAGNPDPAPRPALLASCLAASAATSVALFWLVRLDASRGAQIGSWLLSIALFIALAALADSGSQDLPQASRSLRRWEIVAAAVILIAGLALRLAALDAYPTGSHGDEGEVGLEAVRIAKGEGPGPFAFAWLMHPGLFFHAEAALVQWFGPSLWTIRLLPALTGGLLLCFVFAFTRLAFGARTALLATALNAVSAIDIQFSRLALNNIHTPLFWLGSFYFLLRGWRAGRVLDFALAGVAAGISLHYYFGSRLIPLLLAAILAGFAAADPQRARARLPHLAVLCAGLAVAASPLVAMFWDSPVDFVRRGVGSSLLHESATLLTTYDTQSVALAILYHLHLVALSFLAPGLGDMSTFYSTAEPFIAPAVAPLAFLGLALATLRWRRPECLILALWFWMVFLTGEFLSTKIPYSTKIVPLLPAVSILAALAANELVGAAYAAMVGGGGRAPVVSADDHLRVPRGSRARETLGSETPPRRARLAVATVTVATLVLIAVAAWDQLTGYFVRYASKYPWTVSTMQGQYAERWKADHLVYVAGAPRMYFRHGSTQFLALGVQGGDLEDPTRDLPKLLPPDKGLAVIVYPHRRRLLVDLRERYPIGVESEVTSPLGGTAFITFVVDAAGVPRTSPP